MQTHSTPNSCSDYRTLQNELAEYESLHERDLLPELSTLGFDARAELAEAVVERIERLTETGYRR